MVLVARRAPAYRFGVIEAPGNPHRARALPDWRAVGILYAREMRAALRERNIVINSVLMPIFLYPLMLWAAYTGVMFVQGQTEGFVSRLAIIAWPEGHEALRERFEKDKEVRLVMDVGDAAAVQQQIRDGRIDALVEFLPANADSGRLAGNFRVRITTDDSKERSARARARFRATLDRYRAEWLQREAGAHGINAAAWQVFTVTADSVTSGRQMGAFVLSRMLPVFFVIMVAVGCFHPAVDATAGERERKTWETLMTTAASRVSIITAKYLYVASLGGIAGILNLGAMAVSMKPILSPLLERSGESLNFSIPLAALPVLAAAALLLAGFVAAGMMIFASFARTFKEGQAMITPFYMIIILPIAFLQSPGLEFSVKLACVPVANVVLLVRSVLMGEFPWAPIAVTLGVSLALIAGCVRLAAFILQFEDVVLGSYSGSFQRFLKERVFRRGPTTAAFSRS